MYTIYSIPCSEVKDNPELYAVFRTVYIEKMGTEQNFTEVMNTVHESVGTVIILLYKSKIAGVLYYSFHEHEKCCYEEFLYILPWARNNAKLILKLINAFEEQVLQYNINGMTCYIGSSLKNPEKYATFLKRLGYSVCAVQLKKSIT